MDEIYKICTKCQINKPLSEYTKGQGKYGKRSRCRICKNKDNVEYKKRPGVKERELEGQNRRNRSLPKYIKSIRYQQRKDYLKQWTKINYNKVKRNMKSCLNRRRVVS